MGKREKGKKWARVGGRDKEEGQDGKEERRRKGVMECRGGRKVNAGEEKRREKLDKQMGPEGRKRAKVEKDRERQTGRD